MSKLFPANATFPPPPFMKVQDRGNSHVSWKFFEYWKELAGTVDKPTEHAELVEVRFYMHWPVVSLKLVEPNRTDMVFQMFTGPCWFDDPDDYLEECMKKLGSGGWHVCINEANVHGLLCEAYFSAIDLDRYPVKVDLRTVIKGDPKNSEYIRWLGTQGIKTPWDNPEDEEDMANTDALNIVANVLKDQNQIAIETTKELADVRVEAAQAQVEQMREAQEEQGKDKLNVTNEGIRLITDVAREVVTMAREDRRQPDNQLEMVKTVFELTRPRDESSQTALFMKAITDMQKSNQEMMCISMGMRKAPDGTWMAPPPPAPVVEHKAGFEEEILRFQRMAEIFGYQKPGSVIVHPRREENHEPPQPPEKSFWAALAENPVAALGAITTIITLGANIVYNLMGKGAPVSPQEALVKAQQTTGGPGTTTVVQPQPQQQFERKDPRAWVGFAQEIAPAFRTHVLDSSLGGHAFAEYILSAGTGGGPNDQGRKAYKSLSENLGIVGFDALVRMVPEMWDAVKETPDSFATFMGDFFGYEEWLEQQNTETAQAV